MTVGELIIVLSKHKIDTPIYVKDADTDQPLLVTGVVYDKEFEGNKLCIESEGYV